MNEGWKGLVTSKTFWGVVVMLVGTALGWSPADQAATTNDVMTVVQGVATVAGAALAIYGRIKATKKIAGLF